MFDVIFLRRCLDFNSNTTLLDNCKSCYNIQSKTDGIQKMAALGEKAESQIWDFRMTGGIGGIEV